MADEHGGQSSGFFGNALWLRIFTTFRIALDPKKLLLAGAGLLVMSLGWWFLSVIFFEIRSVPRWSKYEEDLGPKATEEQKDNAWTTFENSRKRYQLLAYLAGYAPEKQQERNDAIAKLAANYQEYDYAEQYANQMKRVEEGIEIKEEDGPTFFIHFDERPKMQYKVEDDSKDFANVKALVADENLKVGNISDEWRGQKAGETEIFVRSIKLKLTNKENRDAILSYKENAKSRADILAEIDRDADISRKKTKRKALALSENYNKIGSDPTQYGIYRTLPWFEDRGPNPFLMVKDGFGRGRSTGYFAQNQLKVLLEPLYKFLSPVFFLFDERAGGWNRIYLIFIILWTLATWAFFGAAITRMAAVQIARPNEKVGLMEAIRFVKERYKSFLLAPLCPLIFILALTVFLIFFGWVGGLIPIVGDIFVSGLFWPVVLIVGLIMAVVLIGLVGWPLMYSTISAEGSDSFDALSRSYSYVYQAPWRYLWYGAVALAYGAILVFFVGLMGSLLVYMGKWGVSQTPFLSSDTMANDREPSYLFYYAPTSFGWRDLLIEGNQFTKQTPNGIQFKEKYRESMTWYNKFGAFLVSIWIYIIFLFVVGFGYSYFWSASTMIYLLLRQKVDDTDLDEVYLDDEEDPFLSEPPSAPEAAGGMPQQQTTDGVTMVETPALRTPEAPSEESPPDAPPAESPPTEQADASEPKKTMLMSTPPGEEEPAEKGEDEEEKKDEDSESGGEGQSGGESDEEKKEEKSD